MKHILVFVTVEADFAIEGYEVDAAAFLVKPVTAALFHRTLNRLAHRMRKWERGIFYAAVMLNP